MIKVFVFCFFLVSIFGCSKNEKISVDSFYDLSYDQQKNWLDDVFDNKNVSPLEYTILDSIMKKGDDNLSSYSAFIIWSYVKNPKVKLDSIDFIINQIKKYEKNHNNDVELLVSNIGRLIMIGTSAKKALPILDRLGKSKEDKIRDISLVAIDVISGKDSLEISNKVPVKIIN